MVAVFILGVSLQAVSYCGRRDCLKPENFPFFGYLATPVPTFNEPSGELVIPNLQPYLYLARYIDRSFVASARTGSSGFRVDYILNRSGPSGPSDGKDNVSPPIPPTPRNKNALSLISLELMPRKA